MESPPQSSVISLCSEFFIIWTHLPSIFSTKEETFQVPPGLQHQDKTFKQDLQRGDMKIQPHFIDNENTIFDVVDFMQFPKVMPHPKNTALHVFLYVACLYFLRFFLISFYYVACQ